MHKLSHMYRNIRVEERVMVVEDRRSLIESLSRKNGCKVQFLRKQFFYTENNGIKTNDIVIIIKDAIVQRGIQRYFNSEESELDNCSR